MADDVRIVEDTIVLDSGIDGSEEMDSAAALELCPYGVDEIVGHIEERRLCFIQGRGGKDDDGDDDEDDDNNNNVDDDDEV